MNIKNRFLQAVKFLYSFFTGPVSLDILTFAKITQTKDKITYEVTDLDNFLKITLPLWTDVSGTYLIDVKTLMKADLKYATKIDKEIIHIGKLRLPKNGTKVKEFPGLQTEFFKHPVWEAYEVNLRQLTMEGNRLRRYTATSDETRSALQNICLRPDYFYATDGHIGLKQRHRLYIPKDTTFVIPTCFFHHLSHEFVLCDSVDLGVYRAGVEDDSQNYIVAKGMSFELVSKMTDDQYPDVDHVIPKKFTFSYTVNRIELLEVVKKAINFAPSKNNMIDITPKRTNQKKNDDGNGNSETLHVSVIDREKGVEYHDSVYAKSNDKKESAKAGNKKEPKKCWNGVSVNAKSLSTILVDCVGSTIEIKANENPISAVIIEPGNKSKKGDQLFIIMPLRKFDEDDLKEEKAERKPKESAQKAEATKT